MPDQLPPELSPIEDDLSTADCGQIIDLASGALSAARQMISGTSEVAGTGGAEGAAARLKRRTRYRRFRDPIYSGASPDGRDPARIGAVVQQTTRSLGWSAELARARVLGQWSELVGPDIAARCQPVSLVESQLRVAAESTAWATQLRLMAPQILARINADLPHGTVTKVIFTGPVSLSWRRGPWSMSGGRGVRDTYG